MISKTGELVEHLISAVGQHGATQQSEIRVRIGATGPEYRIHKLQASTDGRHYKLILQTSIEPTGQ